MKRIFLLLIVICNNIYSQVRDPQLDFITFSTIKIETQIELTRNGKKQNYISSGTGFFFDFNIPKGVIPVIVTNRHVLEGAPTGILYFKSKMIKDSLQKEYKTEKVILQNLAKYWFSHPDTSVDLAVIPIAPILREYNLRGVDFVRAIYTERDIPNDSIMMSLSAIEDVFMVGYPFGLRDISNDMPIIRKGITATPAHLNYNSKSEFLCDLPVFPGSSGSPIIIYNRGSYATKNGIAFGTRNLLLGINYATYTRNFEGKIIPKTSYNIEDSVKVNIPLSYNIGIIIKSQRILDFANIFQ